MELSWRVWTGGSQPWLLLEPVRSFNNTPAQAAPQEPTWGWEGPGTGIRESNPDDYKVQLGSRAPGAV